MTNWREIAIGTVAVLGTMWLFEQRIVDTETRLMDLIISSAARSNDRFLDLGDEVENMRIRTGVALVQTRDELDDLCERVNALHGARGSCRRAVETK